MATRTK